jgi:hypothetical protein
MGPISFMDSQVGGASRWWGWPAASSSAFVQPATHRLLGADGCSQARRTAHSTAGRAYIWGQSQEVAPPAACSWRGRYWLLQHPRTHAAGWALKRTSRRPACALRPQGVDLVEELQEYLLERGIRLVLADPSPKLARLWERSGLRAAIGADWIFARVSGGKGLSLCSVDMPQRRPGSRTAKACCAACSLCVPPKQVRRSWKPHVCVAPPMTACLALGPAGARRGGALQAPDGQGAPRGGHRASSQRHPAEGRRQGAQPRACGCGGTQLWWAWGMPVLCGAGSGLQPSDSPTSQ